MKISLVVAAFAVADTAHARLRRPIQLFVEPSWSDFWLYLGLSVALLVVSAILANVRIGSFPANPLYWHYWVVAKASMPPTIRDGGEPPRIPRLYMAFWIGSICSFVASLAVLFAFLNAS